MSFLTTIADVGVELDYNIEGPDEDVGIFGYDVEATDGWFAEDISPEGWDEYPLDRSYRKGEELPAWWWDRHEDEIRQECYDHMMSIEKRPRSRYERMARCI